MKRIVLVLIVVSLLFSFTSSGYADNAVKKLGRGIANVILCPFGLPQGMGEAQDENGIFAGFTWGLLKGTLNIAERAVVGVYEIATFPIPLPRYYKPILTDPEFFKESIFTEDY